MARLELTLPLSVRNEWEKSIPRDSPWKIAIALGVCIHVKRPLREYSHLICLNFAMCNERRQKHYNGVHQNLYVYHYDMPDDSTVVSAQVAESHFDRTESCGSDTVHGRSPTPLESGILVRSVHVLK